MKRVVYLNQPNCYLLSNGTIEVIVTTDIGPRVIRYGFTNEENLLAEIPDVVLKTEFGDWKPWGGHRLWAAPESLPHTYSIDNSPIEYEVQSDLSMRLLQRAAAHTAKIEKQMTVSLDTQGTGVTIAHQITNSNNSEIETAPWALTIMNGGGMTILPQEPYRSHDDYLLAARPLVLWHFTNLADPRWRIGEKYICLRTDANLPEPQKIGILNKQKWAAYHRRETLFVKQFAYLEEAVYPDYGCNNETYTAGSFMELESLAPLQRLRPGESATHLERWHLFQGVEIGATEAQIEAAIKPRLAQL